MHRPALLLIAFLLSTLGVRAAEPALRVATSIPPHKYVIERIGGERVEAHVMVLPGQNPHTFEPTPKQVGALAQGQIFFAADMPFEAQLLERLKGVAPEMKVIDLQEGITLRRFTADELEAHEAEEHADHHHHDHGHDKKKGDHAHEHNEAIDPHSWMNPRFAKQQAQTILAGLSAADPAGATVYQANFEKLAADLDALDKELTESLASLKGKELLVYHPAFGYFADAYGLKQVAVETGGREPSARQLRALVKRAKAGGVRVIFVQPQFAKTSAETVAAQIGGTVVALDDLGEDYLANLRQVARQVREHLTQ